MSPIKQKHAGRSALPKTRGGPTYLNRCSKRGPCECVGGVGIRCSESSLIHTSSLRRAVPVYNSRSGEIEYTAKDKHFSL